MTTNQVSGLVLGLWLVVALLVLWVAFHAPHFSGWEFVTPQADDPVSWISSGLLYAPPLLLAVAGGLPTQASVIVRWALVAALAIVLAAALVLFSLPTYPGV